MLFGFRVGLVIGIWRGMESRFIDAPSSLERPDSRRAERVAEARIAAFSKWDLAMMSNGFSFQVVGYRAGILPGLNGESDRIY